jgi:hypothetical protein
MWRRLSIVSLWLPVILSAGCDQTSAVMAPDRESSAQRSAVDRDVPFRTTSYLFRGIAAVPEPGCNAAGESRRYLAGEGSATHLGAYTIELSFCARSGGILDDGIGTFVAANGDLLRFSFDGTSTFAPPFTLSFTSYAVFTGGTGRFDGAGGHAVAGGALDVRTTVGEGRWEGSLSSVGSNRR